VNGREIHYENASSWTFLAVKGKVVQNPDRDESAVDSGDSREICNRVPDIPDRRNPIHAIPKRHEEQPEEHEYEFPKQSQCRNSLSESSE